MRLSDLRVGESARITRIEGGRGFKQKLALRDIYEGALVKIISHHGPITVEVYGSTVSIGRGMADKIRVKRL